MAEAPFTPTQFGRYMLVEKLAKGGMAEIYKAKTFGACGFEKTLVVKRILPELASDPEFVEMFIDEAKVMVQINHPKVVQVLDFGEVDGQYFIAMEYIEGVDGLALLRMCVRRSSRPSTYIAVHIVAEVLDALHYAHSLKSRSGKPLGIVHRDISPSNIFISNQGEVKLGDFGIARAMTSGAPGGARNLKGKYGYLAPEALSEGEIVDQRSDIFSAGVVLAELLMVRRLFVGRNDLEVLMQVRDARLDRLDRYGSHITHDLRQILESALARDASLRYQDAATFRDALHRYLFDDHRMVRHTDVRRFFKRLRGDKDSEEYDSIRSNPSLSARDPASIDSPPASEAVSRASGDPAQTDSLPDSGEASLNTILSSNTSPSTGTEEAPQPLPVSSNTNPPTDSEEAPQPLPVSSNTNPPTGSEEVPRPLPASSNPDSPSASTQTIGSTLESSALELPLATEAVTPVMKDQERLREMLRQTAEHQPVAVGLSAPPADLHDAAPARGAWPRKVEGESRAAPRHGALSTVETAETRSEALSAVETAESGPEPVPSVEYKPKTTLLGLGVADQDPQRPRALSALPRSRDPEAPPVAAPPPVYPSRQISLEIETPPMSAHEGSDLGYPGESSTSIGRKRKITLGPPPRPEPLPDAIEDDKQPALTLDNVLDLLADAEPQGSAPEWDRSEHTPRPVLLPPSSPSGRDVDAKRVAALQVRAAGSGTQALGEPTLDGDLEETSALSILFHLALTEETGLVIIDAAETVKEIFIVDGDPRYVASNRPDDLFGQYLVSKGAITEGELSMALAMLPHFDHKLGNSLVGLGLMRPVQVLRHLTQQVRDKLLETLTWQKGSFAFYRHVTCQEELAPLGLNAFEFLGGAMRMLPNSYIKQMIEKLTKRRLRSVCPPPVPPEVFRLGNLPREVFDQLDGRLSIGQILSRFDDEEHEENYARVLILLSETGLAVDAD